MSCNWKSFILALLVGTLLGAICQAQFSSNLTGTVTDSTGAVVPRVAVTVHNTATGVDLKESTNQEGLYRFTSIAPGDYTVSATSSGFKTITIAVTVTTGETHGVDIKLVPGTVSEVMEVTSVAGAINPEETRVQETLLAQEVDQLPLPNRDVQELIALTPGVIGFQNETAAVGYGSTLFAGNFNPPYIANGTGTHANLVIIDDLPVSDVISQGSSLILPNSDMISQVSLQSQTYSVENGSASSLQTSFNTKAGGNAFHGDIDYSYAGKNVGAAMQPVHSLGKPVTNTAPEFHQNLLLASLGGPIYKNRTFFFGSVERQNASIGIASTTTPVFTPQFAAWALQAFPNSPTAYALNWAPASRDVGGSTAGQTAADWYPSTCGTPQTVNGLPYNIPCNLPIYNENEIFSQAQPFNGTQWNVRLDQVFRNNNDRAYVMYERIDQSLGNLAERPKLDAVTPSENRYITVNYLHVFSPRLLNEAHFGNLRSISGSKLGDPRASSVPYLPILVDDGNFGPKCCQFTFPLGVTPFASQTNWEHTYAIRDTVSYLWRNHSFRAGYQFFRGDAFQDSSGIYSRAFVPFYFTDTFSYVSNTATTGFSVYTIGGNGKYNPQYYGATSIWNGLFVEDTWKARPNLTLTLGVRYDDFGNPTKYGSKAQPFVPLFPGTGSTFQQQAWGTHTKIANNAFTQAQNLNVMPRVGVAYSPSIIKNTVIRGGIGLYENALTPFQIAGNLPTQPPNRISLFESGVTVPYGDFQTATPPYGYNWSTPTYGTDPYGNIYSNPQQTQVFSANLNGFAPNIKPEKYINFSLAIEKQLPGHVLFGITYGGNYGYDLIYGSSAGDGGGNADYNLLANSYNLATDTATRPTSEWGTLNYGRNGLSSNWNALIVTVKQNYKHFSYQANYNWEKALQYSPVITSSASGNSYYMWDGPWAPKSYYGPAGFDVTHSFSLGGTYEVPKFAFSKNRAVDMITSHWRVGTIVIAQTGTPFTVTEQGGSQVHDPGGNYFLDYQNTGCGNFNGNGGCVGVPAYSGSKYSGWSRSQVEAGAFTTSQFADPAGLGTKVLRYQQGPNSFRNLGYFNVNLSIAKGFGIPLPGHEEARFYLRGEAVNLLNRTNWQGIKNDPADGNFGTVTAANQKRFIQLGARLEF
jgi:hypothetical protein